MKLDEIFASKAHAKLIQFLIENRGKGFSQNHLARMTGLAPSTVARVTANLENLGLIQSANLEGVKLITLRRETKLAQALTTLHEELRTITKP
ncbi:MAG: helix-turn-helix domain-containing protein [Aigarchaeota archaeon]|nr:helix-turn-helix domain-containing protein [Candidatus Pelearchaeum maunauluense]